MFFSPKQLFHGTPVTIENFLNWKAKFDAELLEIKKKRMKEEEQAGKNKLSGMTDPRFYSPKPSCITSDTARGSFGQVSVRNYYT